MKLSKISQIAILTAIFSIIAPIAIPVPFSPVPISLATFIVYFYSYNLKLRDCLFIIILYLVLGTIGLPIFAGYNSGLQVLLGPTAGYIYGYLFIIIFIYIFKKSNHKTVHFLGFIMGTATCYLIGTVWLSFYLKIRFFDALLIGVLPYLFGDIIKISFTILISRVYQISYILSIEKKKNSK